MSYYVVIFDENQISINGQLRALAIATEEALTDDGYELIYADGDGMLTYVAFDTAQEAVLFKLKYMSYSLTLTPYLLGNWYQDNTIEIELLSIWCHQNQALLEALKLLDDWPRLTSIRVPRMLVDDFVREDILKMMLTLGGIIVLHRHPLTNQHEFKLAFENQGDAILFEVWAN